MNGASLPARTEQAKSIRRCPARRSQAMPSRDKLLFTADAGVLRARPHTIREPTQAQPGRHPLGLGTTRDGILLVPEKALGRPAPLIVALHGAGGGAAQMIDLLARPAEEHGILILAPESRASTWDVIRGGWLDVEF